jgi:hypothetical protein
VATSDRQTDEILSPYRQPIPEMGRVNASAPSNWF